MILKNPKTFLQIYGSVLIVLGILSLFGIWTYPVSNDLTGAPWTLVHYRSIFRFGFGLIILLIAYSPGRGKNPYSNLYPPYTIQSVHRFLTCIFAICFALTTLGGIWMLFYFYRFHPTDLPPIPGGFHIQTVLRDTILNFVLAALAIIAIV